MAQRLIDGGTRERILEQAAGLFAEYGFEGVSMRDVASAVKTTPAALYYHFKDKADLYESVLIQALGGKYSELADLFSSDDPPAQRLRTIVHFYCEVLEADGLTGKLMLRELLESDPTRLRIIGKDILYQPIQLWSDLIRELGDDPRPMLTAQAIGGMLLGYYALTPVRRTLPDDRPEYDDLDLVAEHLCTLLLGGLALAKG